MEIFKLTFKYLLQTKKYFVLLVIASIISAVAGLIAPYLLGRYMDSIAVDKNYNQVIHYTLILLAVFVCEIIVSYFNQIYGMKLQTKASYDLNANLLSRLQRFPLSFFIGKNPTYLNQRVNNDSNALMSFTMNNFANILIKSATFFIAVAILLQLNIYLSLALLAVLPVYAFQYLFFKKPLYKSSYVVKESQSELFSEMNLQIYNIKHIKLHSSFAVLRERMNEKFAKVFQVIIKNTHLQYYFQTGGTLMRSLVMLILFLYGGIQIINNKLTIGQFIIFNNYFNMLLACTLYFLNLGQEYQNTKASYTRINEILDLKEELNGKLEIEQINEIAAINLSFSYKETKEPLLNKQVLIKNFNYKFKKGNIYCLLGENGSGKTTLIDILLGLHNSEYIGEIVYNGININQLDLYKIRERIIGVVEQEPKVALVENNKEESIKNKVAGLSGGEKQQLALQKALNKNPSLLVLDEPTSALDKESVENLKQTITREKTERITIIITHQDNLATIADEIIRM